MSLLDIFKSEHELKNQLKMDKPVASLLDKTASQLAGQPIPRIEGHLKVAGQAPYTAEKALPNQCYGVMVGAKVARGKLRKIYEETATQLPGVIAVVHDPKLFLRNPQQGGMKMAPVQGALDIFYHGQPIALVVGETLEAAQAGALALQVDYDDQTAKGHLDFERELPNRQPIDWMNDPSEDKGKPEKTLAEADVQVDVTYTTPSQSNMPMEPHASLAFWEGDQLTVHTANQMLASSRIQLAHALNIADKQIRMLSPYIGGGFGAKLGIAPEVVMAALAARELKRPVLVTMSRPQVMETTVRRTNTQQRVALGADRDGKIHTIIHNSVCTNLPSELFYEPVAVATHFLYDGKNRQVKYEMVRMNQVLAGSMRAPGEAAGQLALECAMDELAHQLNLCPVELRKLNEPKKDPSKGVPYSTRRLVDCLDRGAEAFGWSKRPQTPGQLREGDWLIGYGVAAAARSNELKPSEAHVKLLPASNRLGVVARVETDMTDIGTGTYTISAQVAADLLGLPLDHVEVHLGDTNFPPAAGSGGSWGAASSCSAIYLACEALREQIAKGAKVSVDALQLKDGQVYQAAGATHGLAETVIAEGKQLAHGIAQRLGLSDEPAKSEPTTTPELTDQVTTLADFLREHAPEGLTAHGAIEPGKTKQEYRHAGFGAQFAEVAVHALTGEVRVKRMLGTFAAGRILNEKTARSQCFGGMVFGIGAALMEEIHHDKHNGRLCNHDLAEYHVPVNADVPDLEVIFLPEADQYANPLHAKGIGELALAGAGAAIANAIFNATGVRIRDYPITLDKLLAHLPTSA